jgi:hypothetical protein
MVASLVNRHEGPLGGAVAIDSGRPVRGSAGRWLMHVKHHGPGARRRTIPREVECGVADCKIGIVQLQRGPRGQLRLCGCEPSALIRNNQGLLLNGHKYVGQPHRHRGIVE